MTHDVQSKPPRPWDVLTLIAVPSVWLVDLQLGYWLVYWTCGTRAWFALPLASAMSLAAVVVLGAVSFRRWRAPAEAAQSEAAAHRARFLALLALVLSGFIALVVIAGAIPRFVLDPCSR